MTIVKFSFSIEFKATIVKLIFTIFFFIATIVKFSFNIEFKATIVKLIFTMHGI